MRALLLHDITPDDFAASVLEAAGHEVVRCGPPRRDGLTCDGIDGRCPLDATVDVAVVVHDRPSADLAVGEAGVICALRDGVPLVLAGNGAYGPFVDRATSVAWSIDALPSACQAAVDIAATTWAGTIGEAIDAEVALRRAGDAIEVRLPADATERTAVLAHQAAHRLFPDARTIDVLRD